MRAPQPSIVTCLRPTIVTVSVYVPGKMHTLPPASGSASIAAWIDVNRPKLDTSSPTVWVQHPRSRVSGKKCGRQSWSRSKLPSAFHRTSASGAKNRRVPWTTRPSSSDHGTTWSGVRGRAAMIQ